MMERVRIISYVLSTLVLAQLSLSNAFAQQTTDPNIRTTEPAFDLQNVIRDLPGRLTAVIRGNEVIESTTTSDWQKAYDQLGGDLRPFLSQNFNTTAVFTSSEIATTQIQRADYDRLVAKPSGALRVLATINKPKLPVLLPPDPEMLGIYRQSAPSFPNNRSIQAKIALFQGFEDHYMATFEASGADILINGSRIEFKSPVRGALKDRARTQSDGTKLNPIMRDEAGVSMSFNRFGSAYHIEIVCADPLTDSRCTQDNFIKDVYAKLLLFGGQE